MSPAETVNAFTPPGPLKLNPLPVCTEFYLPKFVVPLVTLSICT